MRKVLVIDTSVLYVWLKVPGKETCGPSNALVTYEMVSEKIEEEKRRKEQPLSCHWQRSLRQKII